MSANEYVVLDGHEVRPATLREWARQFEKSEARRVARDEVGEASVSTVFLGVDHAWAGGPPLYFETMIFGGPNDQATWRYTTWDQAAAGHAAVVAALVDGTPLP